ncbi:MAG: NADP-dependent oxidoreductase [Gaiellaceae bacterium]
MRAISQQVLGGPEVLELVEIDTPEPQINEVLVRVRAASINPVDRLIRAGIIPPILGEPPFILGYDVSGVVEKVATGVSRFKPGDEVHGMTRIGGGYAEYISVSARTLALKPTSLDHVEAAALPLAGLTAWQGLVDGAALEIGQRVLIHGAGGGVGHLAVQIAKARGAYVIGTTSADKRDFVLGLGADEVLDYRAVDFAEAVRDIDVVLNLINANTGADYSERSLGVIRPGGVLVTAVEREDPALTARAEAAGVRYVEIAVESDYAELEKLDELVDEKRLRAQVTHALPLEEARRAHELIEQGHVKGKIVLTV